MGIKVTIELTPEEAFDMLKVTKGKFCEMHGIEIYNKVKKALEE